MLDTYAYFISVSSIFALREEPGWSLSMAPGMYLPTYAYLYISLKFEARTLPSSRTYRLSTYGAIGIEHRLVRTLTESAKT